MFAISCNFTNEYCNIVLEKYYKVFGIFMMSTLTVLQHLHLQPGKASQSAQNFDHMTK